MGDRISYENQAIDNQAVDEFGQTACPDIANFYDDIVFGDHDLAEIGKELLSTRSLTPAR